jgi:putative hydrolase of the HAD superfamily
VAWVVFDYGGVLCALPSAAAKDALAGLIGVASADLWPAYWQHRPPYVDGRAGDIDYWHAVCRQLDRPPPDAALVGRLVELDVRGWSQVDQGTLGLVRELAADGTDLAILSNAPECLARFVDRQSWADLFRWRCFSVDLGMAKPDPAIFAGLCEVLDASPADVLFVDDRIANVRAAQGFGVEAALFTGADGLRDQVAAFRRR